MSCNHTPSNAAALRFLTQLCCHICRNSTVTQSCPITRSTPSNCITCLTCKSSVLPHTGQGPFGRHASCAMLANASPSSPDRPPVAELPCTAKGGNQGFFLSQSTVLANDYPLLHIGPLPYTATGVPASAKVQPGRWKAGGGRAGGGTDRCFSGTDGFSKKEGCFGNGTR